VETNAAAILVASLYGHGEMDCRGLRGQCIEAGLDELLLYVGGNLVVGKADFSEVEKKFRDMGYDRVYAPSTMVEALLEDLAKDLNIES
jgi:methylaspartate mutase sigma subunit